MLEESSALLADYPFLKLAFVAAVSLITLYGMVRTDRRRRELPPAHQLPDEARIYLDGPTKIILDTLGNILKVLSDIEAQMRAWDIDQQVRDKTRPSVDNLDQQRWADMFKLVREGLDLLRHQGSPKR